MSKSLSAITALALAGAALAASPQTLPAGCRLEEGANSALRIYQCQEQLRIAAEAATKIASIERNGRLVGLRVEGGAVLVESSRPELFRVETAQAVTEIGKARVAVDAGNGTTAVLVQTGEASVGQDGRSVRLAEGQGVDVTVPPPPVPHKGPESPRPGAVTEPAPPRGGAASGPAGLEVKQWGQARVSALMARLGTK